jgi:hypothetical protein
MEQVSGGDELDLAHKDWLDEVLATLGDGLSEYSFANLYLFRDVHEYRIIRGELSFIEGRTYDGCRYLMPLFDPAEADQPLLVEKLAGYDFLFPVSDSALMRMDNETFRASHVEEDSDYLYSAEKLETYRGKKLRKKQLQLEQFLRLGKIASHPMTPGGETDGLRVLEGWQAANGKPREQTDYHQCCEALAKMEALGLSGYIHYVADEPAGFVLAEPLGAGDCVVHFAKGIKKFNGIYPYMFNHLAVRHSGRYPRYNFEQDLGIANFRKNKRSYDPDCLLHKHRVTLRRR